MAAEPQGVAHGRVDLLHRTIGRDRDDRVIRPLAPQGAVRQLGREGGILRVEAGARDRGGKEEVGIGSASSTARIVS